jgi:thioesterase domain-containing protein
MKKVDDLLSELRHLDVQLWAEEDRLRFKAPKGTLTPDLLQELRERKTEILEFLQEADVVTSEVSLVPIQQKGSKPPLFCVYGIFVYYDLARHLGDEQPVYGIYIQDEVDLIQSSPSSKQPPKLLSVVDLAARYLKEIRKQQPVGPYFLAGLSFGGLVAFEIAQQLRAQGEQVALLALFDTSEPGESPELTLKQRLSLHLQNCTRQGQPYIVEKIQRRIHWFKRHTMTMLEKANLALEQEVNLRDFFEDKVRFFTQASQTYQPESYPGKITLFQAQSENQFRASFGSASGWQQLAAGGLEVYEIPGDHLGILKEPHVEILAEKLRMSIDDALVTWA